MKTKDLDAASVASDSPNTGHGQAQHSPLKLCQDKLGLTHPPGQWEIYSDNSPVWIAHFLDKKQAKRFLRAVNNVERLAEALREAMPILGSPFAEFTGAKARKLARSALADYEKGSEATEQNGGKQQ